MRKIKQRKTGLSRLVILAALTLAVPAAARYASANVEPLGEFGARAAIVSAALNMPDGGLALIRERFRAELYGETDSHAAQNDRPDALPAHDQPSAPAADEPEPERPTGSDGTSARPPKIPAKYAAQLLSEDFSGIEGENIIPFGAGLIKNETNHSDEDIAEMLGEAYRPQLPEEGGPLVLIYHTHATESFERYDSEVYDTRNTWRSTDNNNNMAAVGGAMQQVLEDSGIGVLHDTTQHDYPSYNGSYERSAQTVRKYAEEYPSLKVFLDLHRDAMQRDDQVIVKPVALIDGKKAAQIMIISGCDDGTMNMPDWPDNLRFAAAFQDAMESRFPGLTRPVYLCYRKYNMDLSSGLLLLEFGSNANTLDEAIYSAQLAARALAGLLLKGG